ncbi:transcription repressor OFP17-like [Bidens hawaiensis]|uniref:transcription repressor OFP17-like n=1 Tax=Bidens hawaiensis TaxID=980011 RepID=UPI00404A7400
MVTKPSVSTFTRNKLFIGPCKSFIRLFKFKKPIFIRSLRSHKTKPKNTRRWSCLTSFFRLFRTKKDMDRIMELKSFSDAGYVHKAPCPSPPTPAYIKMARTAIVVEENEGEEDACQKFENYLLKMIAEEGKMKDLVDVEELLYCWKNLKSPVFMNLVCRFYGELCKDLFSSNVDNDDDDIPSLM